MNILNINTKKIEKLWKRSLFGDYDGDGVMNAFDCQPKNKKRQDSDLKRFKEITDDMSTDEVIEAVNENQKAAKENKETLKEWRKENDKFMEDKGYKVRRGRYGHNVRFEKI